MKRIGSIAVWLACVACLGPSSSAAAQAPDMREIFPYLMLVIDTSGSMERLPQCTCADLACTNCLPVCNPPSGGTPQKNRWATTLEALTGTFNNFSCEPLARSADNGATYDIGYYIDYHQPWDCTSQSPYTDCAFNSPNSLRSQNANGILDEYKGRVNFGLMTFDGTQTYAGGAALVPVSEFNTDLSEAVQGQWSYGGPKSFHYPNCTTDYMIDTGARSSTADDGSLISLNSCQGTPGSPTCPSWCGSCWNTDPSEITNQLNEDIQEALLSTRPYAGTPIAASLDDLYYHFKNDLTDTFSGCRNRFALLMTDGEPDKDFRNFDCDCNKGTDPLRCGPPPNDPAAMHCPYPLAEDVAFDLVHGRGSTDTAVIQRLFVIGLATDDAAIVNGLNKIARSGCTLGAACVDPVTMQEALFATDLDALVDSLSSIITGFLHPISRSVPAFAASGNPSLGVPQYQVGTGFKILPEKDAPWVGVIERQRITCNTTTHQPETQALAPSDNLHDVVRVQTNPNLLTVVPENGSPDGWVYGDGSTTPCGTAASGDPTGCAMVRLDDSTNSTVTMGLGPADATTTPRRQQILDWMYGVSTSARSDKKLGDIYHSSPVILGRPKYDTVDEAFNDFRVRPVVKDRPITMMVNTNDGMIRAISLETYTAPGGSSPYTSNYAAGQQLWGFVPPLLLNNLQDNVTTAGASVHHLTMDGTPVVKDVYFDRTRGAKAATNADKYHTVLITGMRGGGGGAAGETNAYVALDVTNAASPKFLWQFTDPAMGKTYAQPGIAQAIYRFDPGTGTFGTKNGAVAILPGGVGLSGASGISGDCTNGSTNPSMKTAGNRPFVTRESPTAPSTNTATHRSDIRCWRDFGRALYFVDVETGRLIKKIYLDSTNKRIFPSPLVSTPAVFPGEVGTLASRAYITDADGVIWRVDMSAADPLPNDPMNGWTARPFHDIFWDRGPAAGEVSYEAPILSVDNESRPVIIVATGDTDNFTKTTVENRVVSLTEIVDTSAGVPTFEKPMAAFNWEKRVKPTNGLVASELVTGRMALFAGQLYFGTFIAVGGSDACDMGRGRIFAVDYLAKDATDVNPTGTSGGSTIPTYGPLPVANPAFDSSSTAVPLVNVSATAAPENVFVLGLSVEPRPSCSVIDQSYDYLSQDTYSISQLDQPPLYLTAQGSGSSTLLTGSGGGLQGVELRIKRPKTSARVLSWATSMD